MRFYFLLNSFEKSIITYQLSEFLKNTSDKNGDYYKYIINRKIFFIFTRGNLLKKKHKI